MKKIAILIENLFDEQELVYPYHRLREDYQVELVGTKADTEYKGKNGLTLKSTIASKDATAEEFAGVYIPGGFSPDNMRRCEETVDFVKAMDQAKKPIAAICHGPWMMASACDLKGKEVTSFFSIKDDMVNAGATWKDEEVVVCDNLITSRNPNDLPVNVKEFIKMIEK